MTDAMASESVSMRGLARAAVMVAVVTVAARVVGFARILVFAHTVGPTCLGDTYYTANTVPNILFDVVAGGALSSAVVPVLAGGLDDAERADQTASALLTWTVLVLLPVAAIGAALTGPVISLLVGQGHPGCPAAAERSVGGRMLLVFMPQVLLYGAGIVLTGILQAHRRFFAPAVAPLLSSLTVIGIYLAFAAVATNRETTLAGLTRQHELLLSAGTTLGVVVLVAPLLPALRATPRRLRPALHFPVGVAPTVLRLAVAGAVVLGSQDVATAVVLRLANAHGSSGAVVLFNLAWTVFLLPWAVLAVPVATATFPTLVTQWQRDDYREFGRLSAQAARVVVLACAAAAATLVAVATPAARVVVEGAPGRVPPIQLAHAFIAFAPGVIGFGLVAQLIRAHYARGDVRSPAVAVAVGWLATVILDVAVVRARSRGSAVTALGVGTSVGMTLAALALAWRLHHAVPKSLSGALPSLGASLVAAAGAVGAGAAIASALPAGAVAVSVAECVLVAAVALGIFTAIAMLLDPQTVRLVLRRRIATG
jgi:putative peptidoglycan lipid II flippase